MILKGLAARTGDGGGGERRRKYYRKPVIRGDKEMVRERRLARHWRGRGGKGRGRNGIEGGQTEGWS